MTQKIHTGVNWNKSDDDFTLMFWDQNTAQYWLEKEIVLSGDKNTWADLNPLEQGVYRHILGGLTQLDTKQGGEGMPKISEHIDSHQRKAVLSFMGTMEHIHAKSYSSIFSTLCTPEEIEDIFEWVDNNKYLQKKAEIISEHYNNIKTKKDLYMAMVASVYLESYLFYSGFFYPLYLAGQGKLTASGEIINLIIRDESI